LVENEPETSGSDLFKKKHYPAKSLTAFRFIEPYCVCPHVSRSKAVIASANQRVKLLLPTTAMGDMMIIRP